MTMKIEIKRIVLRVFTCIILLPFVLVACKKSSKATPTSGSLSPNAVNTAAAQTADARRSQAGSMTPTNPPLPTFDTTSIAVTQAAATMQAQITPSPVVTATVVPSTPVEAPTLTPALPVGQDNSAFTFKETIPDGSDFAPGAKFTKSWQLMNTGQTTWTTAYSLVFVSGEQMGGPASVPLKIEVQAGRVVDISVDLTAPEKTGSYKGNWRLRNAAGQVFGDIVFVQIDVVEGGGAASTQPAAGKVKSVSLSVKKAAYTGNCPHTFTFTADIDIRGEATVTFKLELGGGITTPATATETTTFSEGTVQLTFTPAFTASGSGWARLHITSPNDITSNTVEFTLTCQ